MTCLRRILSVFAWCSGCLWPIFGQRKVAVTHIPVPLTVASAWRNRGGQWWEFAIISGGSHVGSDFWGCLRVIYCSTYVGIVFRSLIFGTSIFLMSTSETTETKITTSVRYLIFHHKDTVQDPRPWYQGKAEAPSFLYVLLVWGVALTSLIIGKCQSWAFVLRYYFWQNRQKIDKDIIIFRALIFLLHRRYHASELFVDIFGGIVAMKKGGKQ